MAEPPIEVVGAGSQGIGEMVKFMEDCEVMWAILRFEFGSGAFKRTKMVFLHFNGEDTPVVRRGQANSKTQIVQEYLRGKDGVFHAALIRYRAAEVTAESIMEEAAKTFVVDSMDSPVAMLREYHAQLAREAAAAAAREPQQESEPAAEAPLEVGKAPSEKPEPGTGEASMPMMVRKSTRKSVKPGAWVLKEIGKATGTVDWALIMPEPNLLPLLGSGNGGVSEMRALAEEHQDKVLFGLIRTTFGDRAMKRSKWIFIHIIGNSVKVVSRGRWNALRPTMEKRFREFANLASSISDMDAEDLTAEVLADELKKVSIADDDIHNDKGESIDTRDFKKALSKSSTGLTSPSSASRATFSGKVVEEGQERPEEDHPAPTEEAAAAEQLEAQAEEEEDDEAEPEDEVEIEEEEDICPNSDKSVKEILDLLRAQCIVNWGLFAPKRKR